MPNLGYIDARLVGLANPIDANYARASSRRLAYGNGRRLDYKILSITPTVNNKV